MRTTLRIDDVILKELHRLQLKEGKSLGQLASDLLAEALANRRQAPGRPKRLRWIARSMEARVDLDDKEAVRKLLDETA